MWEEFHAFIEEAKAAGITRCPVRDVAERAAECPIDFRTASPDEAKAAIERFMRTEAGGTAKESM